MNAVIGMHTFGASSSSDFRDPLLLIARMVLGVMFLLSAAAKVTSQHASLTQAVQRFSFDRLSSSTAGHVARLIPIIEFGLAFFLLVGFEVKATSLATTGLLLIFTALMGVHISKGHRFACNCFGSEHSQIGRGTLVRNSILLLLSMLLAGSSWLMPTAAPKDVLPTDIVALVVTTTSVCAMLLIIGETSILSQTRIPAST